MNNNSSRSLKKSRNASKSPKPSRRQTTAGTVGGGGSSALPSDLHQRLSLVSAGADYSSLGGESAGSGHPSRHLTLSSRGSSAGGNSTTTGATGATGATGGGGGNSVARHRRHTTVGGMTRSLTPPMPTKNHRVSLLSNLRTSIAGSSLNSSRDNASLYGGATTADTLLNNNSDSSAHTRGIMPMKNAAYYRYRTGEVVLILNTSTRWSNQVNRYGFPPGEGQEPYEQVGPYNYVLSVVKTVHFDEDKEYYTVTREDTNQEQRADADMMVPIKPSSRGEMAARKAAKERWVDVDDDDDARSSMDGSHMRPYNKFTMCCYVLCFPVISLFWCLSDAITPRFLACYEFFQPIIVAHAKKFLNGQSPYACAVRITFVNILVFCSTWYMFIDSARLAFFPTSADYSLAIINLIVWIILMMELLFEIFIRPDNYQALIISDKAYAPRTVRYISFFHLFIESICLLCFIPEFWCLFVDEDKHHHHHADGSTHVDDGIYFYNQNIEKCNHRYRFSFYNAAMNVIIGTSMKYFWARIYFLVCRLRVFGLVRHWRVMWINNMFINNLSVLYKKNSSHDNNYIRSASHQQHHLLQQQQQQLHLLQQQQRQLQQQQRKTRKQQLQQQQQRRGKDDKFLQMQQKRQQQQMQLQQQQQQLMQNNNNNTAMGIDNNNKFEQKLQQAKLTNASNIGTALMVINSFRALIILCIIMGLFPIIYTLEAYQDGTNRVGSSMTEQLQGTNLLSYYNLSLPTWARDQYFADGRIMQEQNYSSSQNYYNDTTLPVSYPQVYPEQSELSSSSTISSRHATCSYLIESMFAWVLGVFPIDMTTQAIRTTTNDVFLQSLVIMPERVNCRCLFHEKLMRYSEDFSSNISANKTDADAVNFARNCYDSFYNKSDSDGSWDILSLTCDAFETIYNNPNLYDDNVRERIFGTGNTNATANSTNNGNNNNNNSDDDDLPFNSSPFHRLCEVWRQTGNLTSAEKIAQVTDVRIGAIKVYEESDIQNMTYLNGTSGPVTYQVTAIFNMSYAIESVAFSSFLLQICVLGGVLGGLNVLRHDAEVLVLGPLRRMLRIVARYAKNPLAQPKWPDGSGGNKKSLSQNGSSLVNKKQVRTSKDHSESSMVGSDLDDESDIFGSGMINDSGGGSRSGNGRTSWLKNGWYGGGERRDLGNHETKQLITAVSKITDLLRKCWGVAGADMISTNLATREGLLDLEVFDPTVPGKRVYALFAFAAIVEFDHALRNLKGDIMNLINDVAAVLHSEVFRWGLADSGECNKNLGAAFLMVFRIGLCVEVEERLRQAAGVVFSEGDTTSNAARAGAGTKAISTGVKRRNVTSKSSNNADNVGNLSRNAKLKGAKNRSRRNVNSAGGTSYNTGGVNVVSLKSLPGISTFADRAVIGMLKSFAGIHRDDKLEGWNKDFRLGMGVGAFKVNMIFGMDAGWAVEGAVGSQYKIDATYLSPHVNMASRMMSACKQYGVTILLSQAVQELMSETAQSKLRHLDTVTVKGSSVKQKIFTYDARHEGVLFSLYSRSDDQADADADNFTSKFWKNDQDLKFMRQHISAEFLEEFESGRNAYLAGDWKKAIIKLEKANEIMVDNAVNDGYLLDSSIGDMDNMDEMSKEDLMKENGDGPAMLLLNFMKSKGGVAPPGWDGWHPLLSK